ncbi:MAG: sigma-70 family RNA polymerase sigma factor, partial [Gaiellales bacterium]
ALAEKCTQDTFVALWRGAGSFDPARGQLSAWRFTIARNVAITAVRRRRPTVELDERAEPFSTEGPEELVAAADAATRLAEAMATLPEQQFAVLQLAYFEALNQSEIATRLACRSARSRVACGSRSNGCGCSSATTER